MNLKLNEMLQVIFLFILLIGLSSFYQKIKREENKNTSEYYYKMIDKYLLTSNSLGKNSKPYLWIYLSNNNTITPNVNHRNWLSFYSRNTTQLNQPYQYLTIKSIIDKCGDDFNICLIDDESFLKILPDWSIDLKHIANPIRSHLRTMALSLLLNIYGGIIVPSSFICFKSLKPLYYEYITNNKMFVGDFKNNTALNQDNQNDLLPNTFFMGCNANNNIMKEFIKYQEILNSSDFTAQTDFLGNINLWLNNAKKTNNIEIIDGCYIGTKTSEGKTIFVDQLVNSSFIDLHEYSYGLYIPWNELINRISIQWFVRLSPQQVLESNTVIGKYLLLSNKNSFYC